MRLTGFGRFAVAATVVSALSIPTAAKAQKQTENVDRTVAFPSGGTLVLKNFSGDVHITGSGGRDVVIKATRKAEREQLDHIKLDVSTEGSSVVINANKRDAGWEDHKDNVVETTFEIQVPSAAMLDVDAFSSDLDIKGVTGSQKLNTFSGKIVVAGAKGALKAKAFSGDISLDATGAGSSPEINAETFSGTIKTRLSGDAKGEVNFNTFSGSFDSDIPLTVRSMGKKKVSGQLPGGSGNETLYFKTFSGDVKVTK
jgi:DUF4097 and DUF4098 domain-containing protein YvlB